MSDWFSEWFDSKYYHILYKNRDFKEAERFISNIVQFIKLPAKAKTLDLACGKGRHSIFLNSLGYDVLGLDLATNSIEKAKAHESDTLQFGVHDMRDEIPHKNFKLILNAFTSFGYFSNPEDDVKTLTRVKNALAEDGYFVFDFLNAHQVIQNLVKEETKIVDNVTFHLKRFVKNKSICKTISFSAEGKELNFTERVDALYLEDFQEYFETVGLKIKHVFGDYDLNPFEKETSKRLILIVQK